MLAALAAVAEEWGAQWTAGGGGGQLYLPVVAGLRRGLLVGEVELRGTTGGGTRLTLLCETGHWRLHRSAVAVLLLGAVGAVPVTLWPLRAELLALAPAGLVLMFLAWFMVASRLRSAGATEFLDAVGDRLAAGTSAGA